MGRPPCCEEKGLKKGPWTPEEDQKLSDFIDKHGHGSWRALPQRAGLNRCGKSCRLRWTNYLRPDIKRGKFTDEEEQLIINLHSVLGNKWSKIAAHLPGRTDNEIKNFWNTHIRKKLLHMGIDPKTHKPVADTNVLLNLSRVLSTPNISNFMNPWDNGSRLQADAAQIAQIQLLHNILQIIYTSPVPNIGATNLLGSQNYSHLEGLVNGTGNLYNLDYSQAVPEYPNSGFVTPQISNEYNLESALTGYGYPVPGLVSVSATPESSIAKQMEFTDPSHISAQSPTSNFFEDWENLMNNEDSSFWKDIME